MPDSANHAVFGPRRSLWVTVGPSIVVLGSVIGSGELINTPVQAAKFGFILLWAVLLACVLRVFLQVEIGRHCLIHRRTTIQALNLCPGPKWRGTSWVGLMYMALYVLLIMPSIGMIGALAGLCQSLRPLAANETSGANIWAILLVVATWATLSGGVYKHLERIIIAMVATFSVTTIVALVLLQWTPFAINWSEIASGLTFSRGPDTNAANYAIVSLLGALGVTANELFMYPYWIQEKGYGADLVDHHGESWTAVARRWIRSLWFDIGLATVLATFVTVAFFLLGCAVLHRQQLQPTGLNVIRSIGQVYVDTYGPWSLKFFYLGAFCTLASTVLVAVAASGRMVSDLLGSLGFIDRDDPAVAKRVHQIAQPLWLLGILTAYLALNAPPEKIVIFGQFLSGGFAMPLITFGICWMAFHTDQRVRMSRLTATLLLLTSVIVFVCAAVGAWQSGG
jgi:Mn2+/Fe2+ NRAMP family transporter